MRFMLFILAFLAPAAAAAADTVSLSSEVLVERTKQQADGTAVTVREKPELVTPGDKLIFVLSYKNQGAEPATGFVVTNPVPDAVRYAGTEGVPAEVSVDGGKNWGALSALTVAGEDGARRPAAEADVTHLRWSFDRPIPAGDGGKLSFHARVK